MPKSEIEYLKHIKDECDFIIKHTTFISKDDFFNNEVLQKAAVRSLEVIGEATKKVDYDFRTKYYSIPWKEMAGMRDKLIHDYTGVDYYLVWDVTKNSIPELEFQINEIITELKEIE
jgi:uncharacterized protein with HEPN domain